MINEEDLLIVPLSQHKSVFDLSGVIYRITNPEGLIYIGQCLSRCRRRFNYYVNLQTSSPRLKESLLKYGIDDHLVTILEFNLEKEELNEREQYWIKYYNSFENGLNASLGGAGVKLKSD